MPLRLARSSQDEGGQTVVLMALLFTLMLGFGALAIDAGRYYSERRFVQDAVDASALACVRAYARGASSATAWAAGDAILETYFLTHSPSGFTYTVPTQGSETYYDNNVAAASLKNGILPVTSPYVGCRVAVSVALPTYLLKVASPGLTTLSLSARAYAIATGGLIPIVVPKYSNGPGPGDGTDSGFIDHTMANGSDYQCTVSSGSGCTSASTTSPGREFVLFGAGQRATNDNSFRGYIALDVRDFQTTDGQGNLVHTSYNGVAANATVNTLKDTEASWITQGYPGPSICVISTTSFNACAEIAVINGSSSGIFISPMSRVYQVNDYLLAQLYDGTVKTIPNFTINFPSLVVGNSTGSVSDQSVAFTFSSQFRTGSAQVTTTFVPDNGTVTGGTGDATNPWNTGNATSGSFATNPTPANVSSYTQTWSGITTTSAPQGIYVVFLKGVAGAPYAGTTQLNIVTVNIAGQKKQFYIDTSDTYKSTSAGTNATYTVRVTDGSGQNKWSTPNGSYPITLRIDTCPTNGTTTLTCYFGTSSPGTQTTSVVVGGTATLTVEVPSGTTTNEVYGGWLRGYATDDDGHKVTRVLKVSTAVDVSSGGTADYVDVIGYAVFKVTQVTSNDFYGKAVSGAVTDLNSSALSLAKEYRLVPWDY